MGPGRDRAPGAGQLQEGGCKATGGPGKCLEALGAFAAQTKHGHLVTTLQAALASAWRRWARAVEDETALARLMWGLLHLQVDKLEPAHPLFAEFQVSGC